MRELSVNNLLAGMMSRCETSTNRTLHNLAPEPQCILRSATNQPSGRARARPRLPPSATHLTSPGICNLPSYTRLPPPPTYHPQPSSRLHSECVRHIRFLKMMELQTSGQCDDIRYASPLCANTYVPPLGLNWEPALTSSVPFDDLVGIESSRASLFTCEAPGSMNDRSLFPVRQASKRLDLEGCVFSCRPRASLEASSFAWAVDLVVDRMLACSPAQSRWRARRDARATFAHTHPTQRGKQFRQAASQGLSMSDIAIGLSLGGTAALGLSHAPGVNSHLHMASTRALRMQTNLPPHHRVSLDLCYPGGTAKSRGSQNEDAAARQACLRGEMAACARATWMKSAGHSLAQVRSKK